VRGLLLVNPRSGRGGPSVEELERAASRLEVAVRVLAPGDDLVALAREAETEALGIAGGDGSLGAVAGVAIERGLPFVCVPYGTRNHFARDVGLDDSEPLRALAAFRDGCERRIDVGRVGERVFLNNVSLGIYARLVHRREHHRRRDAAFARLRALALSLAEHRRTERFVVEGAEVRASVLLVANNDYRLDVFSLGARERLDDGALHVYAARGLRRLRWTETRAEEVTIDTRRSPARAAVDGEPVLVASPLRLRIEPQALRLLLPERAEA
jgi:diacylglycerol kinase family enzyme